jgi:hypothetical protein
VSGDGVARHARQDGLVGFHAAGDHGRETVEARNAAVFGARHIDAVKGDAGVTERRTTQIDETRLALIALDGEELYDFEIDLQDLKSRLFAISAR